MRRADADFEFAQGYGAEVRNEDDVSERLDSRNWDRADAFDERTLHLRVAVPLAFRTSVEAALDIVDVVILASYSLARPVGKPLVSFISRS